MHRTTNAHLDCNLAQISINLHADRSMHARRPIESACTCEAASCPAASRRSHPPPSPCSSLFVPKLRQAWDPSCARRAACRAPLFFIIPTDLFDSYVRRLVLARLDWSSRSGQIIKGCTGGGTRMPPTPSAHGQERAGRERGVSTGGTLAQRPHLSRAPASVERRPRWPRDPQHILHAHSA